jgi:hypothetical protein
MDFESAKSPNSFMDSAAFGYDIGLVDSYMQYPHSPSALGLVADHSGFSSSSPDFSTLNLSGAALGEYSYGPSTTGASYTTSRPFTPGDGVSPPALYSLSAEDVSSDHSSGSALRRSGGSLSPPNVPYTAASIPRSHRFNPIAPPSTRSSTRVAPRRRSSRRDDDSDDDDDDFQPTPTASYVSPDNRREAIRRQRIESEQRRRDELREGYRRLKDALPVSNQKSSKVSLLDRATTHIKYLEVSTNQLQTRLQQAEAEVARLRNVNEALMLGTAEQRQAVAAAAAAAVVQQSQQQSF